MGLYQQPHPPAQWPQGQIKPREQKEWGHPEKLHLWACTSRTPVGSKSNTAPGWNSPRRVLRPPDRHGGLSICQGIWPLRANSPQGNLKMDMEAPGDTRSLPPYFLGARCPQAQLLREGSGWPPPLCLRQVAQHIPPPFSSVSWDSSFSKCFLFCCCFILPARRAP